MTAKKAKLEAVEPADDDDDMVDDIEMVTVVFKDQKFSFPKDADNWNTTTELARVKARATQQPNDWYAFLEDLLGTDQWQLMLRTGPKRPDLYEFTGLISTAIGKECII